MLSYYEVLPHILAIIDHKACVVIAPYELALLSKIPYLVPTSFSTS
jgi:hypothetical protein